MCVCGCVQIDIAFDSYDNTLVVSEYNNHRIVELNEEKSRAQRCLRIDGKVC